MIAVNELRIGNIVYNDYMKCNGTITGIFENEVWIKYQNESILSRGTISVCHPIPLTEEWLVKMGFVKIDKEYILRIGHYKDLTFAGNEMYLCYGQFSEMSETVPCEYVHQLQNLYFALTGEELTIK